MRLLTALTTTWLACLLMPALATAQVSANLSSPTAESPAPAAGTGSSAISGVVVDATTRQPLGGTVVTLSSHPRFNRAISRMLTDDLGRFVFTTLPAGNQYYLHTSHFGYFEGGLGREIPGQDEGRPIALTDDQWVRDLEIAMLRVGAIGGRVIDEAGEPVVGVPVRALPVITLAGVEHIANGLFTRTDDRGAYRIVGLAPGRYLVSVPSVQGAVPSDTSAYHLAGMTEERFAASARMGRAPTVPAGVPVASGHTLMVGEYPTGPSPRGTPQAYPPMFYPSAYSINEAIAVEPRPGEDLDAIDIQLRPQAAVRVSGHVVGPAGAMAGMVLRLMSPGTEAVGRGSEVATALVGAGGTFTFLNVPVGQYTLLADRTILQYHYTPSGSNLDTTLPSPAGFNRSRGGAGEIPSAMPGVGYDYQSLSDGDRYFGRADVIVTAGGVNNVVVPLQPTVAIRGRIVWEGGTPAPPMRAQVTPDGLVTGPADTLPVSAEPADGSPMLGMPRGEYVIATNQFSVEGLRPGEYMLGISGIPAIKSIMWSGRDYRGLPFDAALGQDFNEVVITVTDDIADVIGSVRDETGQHMGGGEVLAFPTDEARWSRFGFRPAWLQSASIRSDGTYALQVPQGDYFLVAVDRVGPTGWQTPAFLRSVVGGAVRIHVDWGDAVSENLTVRRVR